MSVITVLSLSPSIITRDGEMREERGENVVVEWSEKDGMVRKKSVPVGCTRNWSARHQVERFLQNYKGRSVQSLSRHRGINRQKGGRQ